MSFPFKGKRFTQDHLTVRTPAVKRFFFSKAKPQPFVRVNRRSDSAWVPWMVVRGDQWLAIGPGFFLDNQLKQRIFFGATSSTQMKEFLSLREENPNIQIDLNSAGVDVVRCVFKILEVANDFHSTYMKISEPTKMKIFSSALNNIEAILAEAGLVLHECLDAYEESARGNPEYTGELRYKLALVHDRKLAEFFQLIIEIQMLLEAAQEVYTKTSVLPGHKIEAVLKSLNRQTCSAKEYVQEVNKQTYELSKTLEKKAQ